MTATGRGQDFLRTPRPAGGKAVAPGRRRLIRDFAPTNSQIEVRDALTHELAHDREQMDGLFARRLAAFNAMLGERQLGQSWPSRPNDGSGRIKRFKIAAQ